jgi:uncharacterized protein
LIELPILYACRKCSRDYSKQEYDQSRFCPNCGSFLIAKFISTRIPIPSTKGVNQADKVERLNDNSGLTRAAERLKQRIVQKREYSVISEEEPKTEKAHESVVEGWIWNSEYDKALKLKDELVHKYTGKRLEETFPGEVISNEQGKCYYIPDEERTQFKTVEAEESERLLLSDLKIIPGIGPVTEERLKSQGYNTIRDLTENPKWGKHAKEFLETLRNREIGRIQDWLWQRFQKSHPLSHYLAGLCSENDFAVIDIETLGLFQRPIILLGIAKPEKGKMVTHQFLLRDIDEEPAAVWEFISKIGEKTSLISFNGRGFDVPYIKQRLAYYGLDAPLNNQNFDMLHFTRRALGKRLPDCRLDTVESKYLSIQREIDIPGALVPNFYDSYRRTKNVGPLVAIVEHNKQDLLTLAKLFSKLYEEWHL